MLRTAAYYYSALKWNHSIGKIQRTAIFISHVVYFDNLTVSFFSVRTAEWCLPLVQLNRALAIVIQMAQDYASKHRQYSLLPIYVRLVKTDDLFLSPASKFRPDSEGTGSKSEKNCYIEVREIIGPAPSVSNSLEKTPILQSMRVLAVPSRD